MKFKCDNCDASFFGYETNEGQPFPLYCPFCGEAWTKRCEPTNIDVVWNAKPLDIDYIWRRPHERVCLTSFVLTKAIRGEKPKWINLAWSAVQSWIAEKAIGDRKRQYALSAILSESLRRLTKVDIAYNLWREGFANGIIYREWLEKRDDWK